MKFTEISKRTSVPRSTIQDIFHRFNVRGSVETAPKSGRPQKLLDWDIRQLTQMATTERQSWLSNLSDGLTSVVSGRKVQRSLHSLGFRAATGRSNRRNGLGQGGNRLGQAVIIAGPTKASIDASASQRRMKLWEGKRQAGGLREDSGYAGRRDGKGS
ncbi:hypothetical protein PPACK8108_LOCUS11290 [Phakopsora pachyrhizi]|uniref:Uncharacterized protein n=1 Tax=Phakopsora pachyrhizi TaxID=170000 RepID=A0AAV0B3C2_PHAPC|nr:hypothetical protein PPACK8108_LOCUS11290 [Phakopsora pachyrhizi]